MTNVDTSHHLQTDEDDDDGGGGYSVAFPFHFKPLLKEFTAPESVSSAECRRRVVGSKYKVTASSLPHSLG